MLRQSIRQKTHGSGNLPRRLLEQSNEITSMSDVTSYEIMDRAQRRLLMDKSADPVMFESDAPRTSGASNIGLLNARYNGGRGNGDNTPNHSEMFLGLTGDDPRGTNPDLDYKHVVADSWHRSKNYSKSLNPDVAEHTIGGGNVSQAKMGQLINRDLYEPMKKYFHTFDITKECDTQGKRLVAASQNAAGATDERISDRYVDYLQSHQDMVTGETSTRDGKHKYLVSGAADTQYGIADQLIKNVHSMAPTQRIFLNELFDARNLNKPLDGKQQSGGQRSTAARSLGSASADLALSIKNSLRNGRINEFVKDGVETQTRHENIGVVVDQLMTSRDGMQLKTESLGLDARTLGAGADDMSKFDAIDQHIKWGKQKEIASKTSGPANAVDISTLAAILISQPNMSSEAREILNASLKSAAYKDGVVNREGSRTDSSMLNSRLIEMMAHSGVADKDIAIIREAIRTSQELRDSNKTADRRQVSENADDGLIRRHTKQTTLKVARADNQGLVGYGSRTSRSIATGNNTKNDIDESGIHDREAPTRSNLRRVNKQSLNQKAVKAEIDLDD